MKKLILAVTIVFLLLSCGPSEKEKYEELFDDDNPLIGTWEKKFTTGSAFLVFIDDSTMYFDDTEEDPNNGVIYPYKFFDHTPVYENGDPSIWKIAIWLDVSTTPDFDSEKAPNAIFDYLSKEKIVVNPAGDRYTKIKK